MSNLLTLLKKHKKLNDGSANRNEFNLQSMYSTVSKMRPGKYYIGNDKKIEFIESYYKYTFDEKKDSFRMYI